MRNRKISTGKKIFVALVATIGFLTFSSLSLADSLNETINEKKTATQTWEIDAVNNPGDNQVTFTGVGSIEVTEATPDRVIAANVTFLGTPSDDAKRNSLLTVNFNNDASVVTDIPVNPSDPTGDKVQAHIYAKSTQDSVPAVGINLEQGANLAIDAPETHRPTLAAYSSSNNSAATTISAKHTNIVNLNNTSSLFSTSDATTSSGSYSVSSVIGSAVKFFEGAEGVDTLTATLGANNVLTSYSYSPNCPSNSASSVIGAACGSAITQGGNSTVINVNTLTATLESGNTLTSFATGSTSYGYSASNVIGAAIVNMDAQRANSTVTTNVNGLVATFSGTGNTLTSSATGFYSASSVIGAAVGDMSAYASGAAVAINVNNLTATFSGTGNTLTSSATGSFSASSVIGAAIGRMSVSGANSTVAANVDNLTANLGTGNTLTSSSFSSASGSYLASSVIGAAVGNGTEATVTVNNLTAMLGNGNNISSSATGYSSDAASSVIGAAVGNGTGATVGVSGLAATLGDGNTLTSSSSLSASFYSSSASSVIGAAVGGTSSYPSTANGVTVNMNGSQTLSAVAYAPISTNIKVNTFGADKTDKGDGDGSFGWRVGIFADSAVGSNSTVNILGAKLGNVWEGLEESYTENPTTTATATLGGDQGTDSSNYARAFALGNDFKIYIGGRANADDHEFSTVASNGRTNVVNIIGAISKGKNSTGTEGSSLTVDSGWTVNAFGPVEDLAEISVTNGSHLNVYGPMRNDVISGGEVMVYGATTGIGTIELREGNLHLSHNDGGTAKFNDAIGQIAGKMTYVDPGTGTLYKGSDGKIAIEVDPSYPWKGADAGGQLTLSGDDRLVFHVDSSQEDRKIESTATNGDVFELVKGYVTIDAGMENAITLGNGNLAIINDDADSPGTLPAHADFWLIRSTSDTSTEIDAIGKMFGFTFTGNDNFELVDGSQFGLVGDNLYKMTSDYAGQIFSKEISPYANWDEALDVYIFNDPAHASSGLFLGTGETPRHVVPSMRAATHANAELASLAVGYANAELASLSVDITALVSKTLYNRMASAKGWFGDPFINIIYEHSRQAEIAGFGYNNNTGGFLMGIDNIWTFPNERYLSLGAAFGYIHGKTNFFGSASGLGKSAKHDAFTLALFSAYELFNDKNLKTNIRLILGYSHGKDSLSRTDPNYNDFSGNLRSNNAFLGLEFVKNLYAHNGCQFGLWCRANYSRIAQKGYDESSSATMGAQHVSAINHNFLATVVGINIEKEVFNPEYADRKLTLSLKAGWESQIVRKHSDARVSFDGSPNVGEFSPILGYPSRNAAIVSLGASKKLNVNWSITGSYVARFNRDISIHNLSCGIKYSF